MKNLKNINIGQLIKEKFEEKRERDQTLNISEFARRINISRSAVYLLFKQKSIDIELLIKISEVLEFNFIEDVYLDRKETKPDHVVISFKIPVEKIQEINLPTEFITRIEKA